MRENERVSEVAKRVAIASVSAYGSQPVASQNRGATVRDDRLGYSGASRAERLDAIERDRASTTTILAMEGPSGTQLHGIRIQHSDARVCAGSRRVQRCGSDRSLTLSVSHSVVPAVQVPVERVDWREGQRVRFGPVAVDGDEVAFGLVVLGPVGIAFRHWMRIMLELERSRVRDARLDVAVDDSPPSFNVRLSSNESETVSAFIHAASQQHSTYRRRASRLTRRIALDDRWSEQAIELRMATEQTSSDDGVVLVLGDLDHIVHSYGVGRQVCKP